MYDQYISNQTSEQLDMEHNNEIINSVLNAIENVKEKLSETVLNRFWLMYVEIVEILFNNVMAERCGSWDLYLSSDASIFSWHWT